MEKEKICPACSYPLEEIIIRKCRYYRAAIIKLKCNCCGHEERQNTILENYKEEKYNEEKY